MIYRAVEDPHNGYWNIVTVADDDAVAMVWEKADAFAIVSALNGITPRPEVVTRLANAVLAHDCSPAIIDLALAYSSPIPQGGDAK